MFRRQHVRFTANRFLRSTANRSIRSTLSLSRRSHTRAHHFSVVQHSRPRLVIQHADQDQAHQIQQQIAKLPEASQSLRIKQEKHSLCALANEKHIESDDGHRDSLQRRFRLVLFDGLARAIDCAHHASAIHRKQKHRKRHDRDPKQLAQSHHMRHCAMAIRGGDKHHHNHEIHRAHNHSAPAQRLLEPRHSQAFLHCVHHIDPSANHKRENEII
mmetsp:Transcript_39573/g.64738  ORF Transcript_39573/g.64738 Transcript_39573/m.64738 type:complete len:215 (-) Transcript_39573:61-705(-)